MALGKVYPSPEEALADVFDGATILVGGAVGAGLPENLLRALSNGGARGLTLVYSAGAGSISSTAGNSSGKSSIESLVMEGRVSRIISPMPFPPNAGGQIEDSWRQGEIQIEILPQGVLAERLRAGGAGLGGVFLPTALGTRFQEGRERREIDGKSYLLETPLKADFALLKARAADTFGSLVYQGSGRNWGPVMAMAARIGVAEVGRICEPGGLDPEAVVTPGIFVNRLVECP
ncbi:MAG: 3-oxoacid CoA-transferase subunit A [Chloroflexi bacterium]|nr:3-oxoacid CoA-transferase subunit A [Chloroflexota bacterium]